MRRTSILLRVSPTGFTAAACLLLALGLSRLPASAQLRPLDPVDWDLLSGPGYAVEVGAGFFTDQRASLAGADGRLAELGTFRLAWSVGRASVDLAGTAWRIFDEQSYFADLARGVEPSNDGRRHDNGDIRLSTTLGLTGREGMPTSVLRFGVRLPTTHDQDGIERDQMDFWASLVGRRISGPWELAGEFGFGIYGARDHINEHIDPLLFGATARYELGAVDPVLEITGHHDTRPRPEIRGNEDLGEARLGFDVGGSRSLSFRLIRGWTRGSPDFGAAVSARARF